MVPRTQRLLEGVRSRQWLMQMGRWSYRGFWVAGGLYLVGLVVWRVWRIEPAVFGVWSILMVPGLAVLAGVVMGRKPGVGDAARLVDSKMGTKDLFLTAAMIEGSAGMYQPLVVRGAEQKAESVRVGVVVPFEPWVRGGHVVAAMLVVLGCVLWFEPNVFGEVEKDNRQVQLKRNLREQTKLTAQRAEAMKRKDLEAALSKPTELAVNDLKKTFNQMKPRDKAGNLRQLMAQQRKLEDMWRQASRRKLEQSLSNRSSNQRFGAVMNQQNQPWLKQLERGDASGIKQQLEQLKQLAQQLAQTKDPMAKRDLQQQIQSRLEQLAEGAKPQAAGGPGGLGQTLNDALNQLQMAKMGGLSDEALEALEKSLELGQMDAESLAQSLRDMKSLEAAMKTLQQAKSLNSMQPLDGKAGQGCQSMAEYSAMYQHMISQCQGGGQGGGQSGIQTGMPDLISRRSSGSGSGGPGGGSGGGMGGPGRGRGGVAPEDPTQQNQFKTQKSLSALRAGRILLQWKTREVSPSGQVRQGYLDSVAKVKQGVSEAILQEEVPPGYHNTIQKYFDTFESTAESKSDD